MSHAARTVMLVDDSRVSRMLASAIIRDRFPEGRILEAADGASALDMLESQTPDLLVLDMNMPGMTGMEVAAALRSRPIPVPFKIAMLSANIQDSIRNQAEVLGVTFFRKPINEKVIDEILLLMVNET